MSESNLTPAEERVKAYLEEQIKTDTALAAVYNPSKIKQCFTYITDQARKVASGNSCWVDDAEVWKWARDYYIEELPKEAERIAKVEAELDKQAEAEEQKEEPAVDVTPVQETVKEVTDQIEEDAKKDDVVRDEYGFEVFGEEADEPEEAEEETAEESCHQDEVEETDEAPEIKALEPNEEDDVFLSGQAFNAGDIIDKHGRRIFFKDLIPGMRFVRADYPDSLQYMVVCVVKNIKENRFSYDNNEHDIDRYSYDSKDYFDSETSKCGGFGYAVPGDAMIIGKIVNGERDLFEEAVAATADYDNEGNGLLFGF